MQPWTLKYQAKTTSEIIGQERALKQIKDFIQNYKVQKKKALLLYGPPGSGKTSSIIAAAREFDLELFEVNASDKRNKAHIEETIGNVINQVSLFAKEKIILIDEIDGLSGKDDRGGVSALAKVIKDSKFPILMTANDGYSDKLKAVRKESIVISLHALRTDQITEVLSKICSQEGISCNTSVLSQLARKSQGDLRAAINDIEITARYSKSLTEDNVMMIDQREKKESLMNALVKVLKNRDLEIARSAYKNVNENLDEIAQWLRENVPKEYSGKELALAYDALSKASVFKGRIMRRQYWRYLVYIDSLLSVGVAISKEDSKKQFLRYERSKLGLSIWMLQRKYGVRKGIAEKLAEKTHCSKRVAVRQILYLKPMFENQRCEEIISELGLDEKEVEWLQKPLA